MNKFSKKSPITKFASLHTNLEGLLDAGNELLKSLEVAKSKPHVLDDAIVANIKRVYTDQQKEIKKYENVLTQWLKEKQTEQQKKQLKAFKSTLQAVINMNKQVFFLIDFFEEHTIEKILMKEDLQLGMDLLTGQIFPPDNDFDQTITQHSLVPSKLIPCEKCGKLIAHLVFAENATIENMEYHNVMMRHIIKKKNVDTWIIGEPLQVIDDNALAYVMKVWPRKCKPKKMFSSDFNHLLEELEEMHC